MHRILLLSATLLFLSCSKKEAAKPEPPKIPVVTVKAETTPLYEEFIGQIYGSDDIDIRARVEGFVKEIHFKEGFRVKKGDKLYTLESDAQNASVLERQSKLAEAKTTLARAKSDLERIKPLAEMKAVSEAELDKAQADYNAAKATVAAAQANLKSSQVTQGYTEISAPNDGIIGKSRVRVGDVVGSSPDNSILSEISSVDSVRVEFYLPENLYLELYRKAQERRKRTTERAEIPIKLFLSDGSEYPHPGRIDFIDRSVDPTTGAILIQSTFINPDGILRPGLFARILVQVGIARDAILVPQRSITELQSIYQVATVTSDNVVAVSSVKAGSKIGNRWLIEEGLKNGDKVVFEGLQKVRDGMVINPIDTTFEIIPAPDSTAILEDSTSEASVK